jgi:predicted extracellular nuclease
VDYNPEVLLIGSKTMNVPQTRAQDTVALTGVVDYDKGWICIQPLPDSLNLSHSSKPVSPVSKRSSGGTLRISTFDFGGFFDTIDTWGKNDYVSTAAKYSVKIAKMTKAISQELLMPVILCAQNVENTGVLSDIAANVNLTANGKYKVTTGRIYMGFSVDTPTTPDPRGLINGFLYDTTQFKLDSIILMSGPSIDSSFGTYNPQPSMWAPWGVTSQMPAPQPLIGFFKTNGTTLVIVNACLTDKSNDNSCFATGWPFSEQSKQVRIKQAFAVRNWIDAKLAAVPSVPMMVVGEFNDYPFAEPLDGTIYPVSIVAGSATKGETVFYNAYDYLSPDSRYTCIVNGRAQMTEQVMVNSAIATYAKGIDVLHFNANFEDSFATDSTTAVRVSSHDPVEIRF